MASLYAQYLTERTNDEILESPDGFVIYRYLDNGETIYIIDIYVVPEAREKGTATALADKVVEEAKAKGAKKCLGSVRPSAKNSTISLQVLIGYGMKLDHCGQDYIVFRKDL